MVAELTTTVPVTNIKTPLVDIEPTSFVPLRYAFPWSEDLFRFGEAEDGSLPMIDRVGVQTFEIDESIPDRTTIHVGVAVLDELLLEMPGLSGVGIVFGAAKRNDDGTSTGVGTEFGLAFGLGDPFSFGIEEVDVVLRMQQDLLRSVIRDESGKWVPAPHPFEMRLDGVGVSADTEGSVAVTFAGGAPGIEIDPFAIGDTGIIVEPDQPVRLFFSQTGPVPPGRPAGWRGVYIPHALVHLPHLDFPVAPTGLEFSDCSIGTGGFSGELEAIWNPQTTTGNFLGMTFGLSRVGLKIVQNVPVRSTIEGHLTLPFFERKLAVEITIAFDGSFTAKLSPVQPEGVTYESGIVTLEKAGLMRLKLESIGFELQNGVFKAKLAGEITPLVGAGQGVEWTSFHFDELSIDSKGRVHLDGGWMNTRDNRIVKFHGFQLEISKLGFGNTEDGGKWIGFSGGVKLVQGMPAGASVEGLRVTWYDDGSKETAVSLNGVRVQFEVPNTLKFVGEVSYIEEKQEFRGAVKLDLMALKMEVDATAVFGLKDGNEAKPYLAIYLAAEFPAGIPLFATGLGLYGAAGLFAMNMEPNRAPSQAWYSLPPDGDWYHGGPEVGVTNLQKWTATPGSFAFGAGVTLGTIADNGHTFSGRMLLAIIFPGPILLLQGSANILRERATLADDASFRALAVLDGRAGTLQLGLDAKYRYDNDGNLVDINGAAEGFFNFNDPNAWRLNVGLKEPRDRRLTARLFKLFDSYSYVMLNSQELAMGAWVGFQRNWSFGPLNVGLEAWIDGNARVSWKPAHFYGDLALHGSARLSVFGFSAGLTVDASIAAEVFDPLHIKGDFNVAIDLPWPLGDIAVGVNLEWGPQQSRPPFPLPLKEVAIEHFKASTSWTLPRAAQGQTPRLLFPNYDHNGDGFFETPTNDDAITVPSNLNDLPIVPLDSRPHLTFARNINDDALVGVNAMPMNPDYERIGDPATDQGPATIRYGLKEVALEKRNSSNGWDAVAYKGPNPIKSQLPTLFGSWAPVPQMPGGGGNNVGQTKLWLWSKTPFEYTRRSSRSWDEWFTDEHSEYPCQTLEKKGWDFEKIDPTRGLPDPWTHPDEPGLTITLNQDDELSIRELTHPSHGLHHAFGISGNDRATITLPRPSNLVRILITDGRLYRANDFTGFTGGEDGFPAILAGTAERPYIEIRGKDMTFIEYVAHSFHRFKLAENLSSARGSDYNPDSDQIIFVEFNSGNLSAIHVATGDVTVLGTGYDNPEDIVLSADRTVVYITENVGTLLRVDLTGESLDRSAATVITRGMTAPCQIALDEESSTAYVVEFIEAKGRLLSIDLEGPTAGTQKPIVGGLDKPFGLLLAKDRSTAYVSEIGNGGRLSAITLGTGALKPLYNRLDITFFLRWENEDQNSILAMQWNGDGSNLVRFNLNSEQDRPDILQFFPPFQPWSVLVLPNDRYVMFFDGDATMFAKTLLIPEIVDVGGSVFARHFTDELARWQQTGDVLEPHTNYRLNVTTTMLMTGEGQLAGYREEKTATEFAYFRTAGPPGAARLTPPAGSKAVATPPESYVSSLDDLSRYVVKTMPRAIDPAPVNPVPSRLAYRSYDLGLEFDENYVELMYRIGQRDLSLHIHDGNGAVRNDKGRRLIISNKWGQAETVTLTDHEERWLSVMSSGGCALVPIGSIVKDTTMQPTSVAHVLPPSSLCEARLIPALLHDDFGSYGSIGVNGPGGRFGRWQVRDLAGENSRWEVHEADADSELAQMKPAATSMLIYENAPLSELPADHPDQPLNWTDYRLTADIEFAGGKAGVVWRCRDAGNHYRFTIDKGANPVKCELFRVVSGAAVRLADTTDFTPPAESFPITVEVTGSTFEVYHKDKLILSATDVSISSGSVGFYTSGTASARFTDIYVDDFSTAAPVVYRFSFLSSRFMNFKDHLESFEKTVQVAAILGSANAAPFVNASRTVGEDPSDAESRGYDGLLALLPEVVASPVVRVTRVEQSSKAIAFLVQSPEPLDWKRINVSLTLPSLRLTETNVPIKVLRKADGSGIMIVSPSTATPSGSFFAQGQYRLTFTYRRDNRSKDPKSDVLSERGITTPEQVTLDLPWPTQQQSKSAEEIAELLVPA